MIRLIGALLIGAGGAWLGFGAAGRLGARVRALEELAEGLGHMARELELDQPPLEQLLERLIPGSRGAARTLFTGCRGALDRLEEEPFARAWARLVEGEPLLSKEGQACLLPLGQVLGRCGWEEEQRALDAVARRLEEEAGRAREERRRMGRVYEVLGVSGGAFLVILLL